MYNFIKNTYQFRGFILSSVRREFQSKYRTSILGPVWIFAQPISLILVYTIVFSTLMRGRIADSTSPISYSIFLCSGIIFWNYFMEMISKSTVVYLQNANSIKKISFPKICLTIVIAITSSINFSIIMGVFIIVMIVTGSLHPLSILYVIPLSLLMLCFALSLGMILGLINVFFRDVGNFINVFMQFWFWLTPIVYPLTILPQWAKDIVLMNPLTGIVISSQSVFVKGYMNDFSILLPAVIASVVLSLIGIVLFKKRFNEMVDEL
ncbi:ABC transporter permease [Pantoea sp. EA-12]|uniref:ABC transporter permease n=1 Tax=Pantoea sp. EA-12 TaxID=3043303 RepID=UPI0024B4B390|nr:ABC transporter permease [Pantoea sp. EA-12]MDI9219890.1 ABC transporter permease [Pantoea sp. EA-12]